MPPQYFYKSFCEAAGIPQEVMHLQGLTTFWPPIECISGQGKVCSQLLPWPVCREAERARPMYCCTLRAHTSPQTAWRGQFSTHLPSSEGAVCTCRPQNKSSLIYSSAWKGGYYFLITCSCDSIGAGIQRSGTSPTLNLPFFFRWQSLLDICTSKENYLLKCTRDEPF